jgi:hypothetical protein
MPYTTEDGGKLNNFANEPKMYEAAPPNKTEQRNYIILAALGFLLLAGVITIAVLASNVSAS